MNKEILAETLRLVAPHDERFAKGGNLSKPKIVLLKPGEMLPAELFNRLRKLLEVFDKMAAALKPSLSAQKYASLVEFLNQRRSEMAVELERTMTKE